MAQPQIVELLQAVIRWDKYKILPLSGGWYDQTEAFLQAVELLNIEMQSYKKD